MPSTRARPKENVELSAAVGSTFSLKELYFVLSSRFTSSDSGTRGKGGKSFAFLLESSFDGTTFMVVV